MRAIERAWCWLFHRGVKNVYRLTNGKYNCRKCGLAWSAWQQRPKESHL